MIAAKRIARGIAYVEHHHRNNDAYAGTASPEVAVYWRMLADDYELRHTRRRRSTLVTYESLNVGTIRRDLKSGTANGTGTPGISALFRAAACRIFTLK